MPRKKLFQLLVLITVVLVFISGCGDDDNPASPVTPGQSSITLNGGGFSNLSINMAAASAGYDPTAGQTYVFMYGVNSTDTVYVYVGFDGQGTGSKPWEGVDTLDETFSGALVQMGLAGSVKFYVPASGSTQVTAYGNVGQKITGTFSGTCLEMTTLQEVSLSGSFDAIRVPDNE